MKKLLLLSQFILTALFVSAQWTQVSIGNSTAPVSCLTNDDVSLAVGTSGDGIFRTMDNGSAWTDISGNIGNKTINYLSIASPIVMVGTQNGPFFTGDFENYTDATSTGLTSTDVTYYGFGASQTGGDHVFAVGTNGSGIFTSASALGPWSDANVGITGDGLFINCLTGYRDDAINYGILGTNGGVYFTFDLLTTWEQKNNGLTGNSLIIKGAYALGTLSIIATNAGLYYSMDFGDTWITLLPDVKINSFIMHQGVGDPVFFIFGDNNLYSLDLQTWNPIIMDGYTGGEVVAGAVFNDYIFIASAVDGKEVETGGVLFKAPYNMVVGLDENTTEIEAELSQNVPNPFNQKTEFHYNLKRNGMVSLNIFDLHGRKIVRLINEFQVKGNYSKTFDAGHLPEGVYFYQLSVGNEAVATKKMVIVK